MIDDQQDVLSFSLDYVSVEVSMRLRDICLGLVSYGWLRLLLNEGARVAVVI